MAYLYKESEEVEAEHSDGKSPRLAVYGKSVELSKHHYIHEQSTHYQVRILHTSILSKVVVNARCQIEKPIFHTSHCFPHQERLIQTNYCEHGDGKYNYCAANVFLIFFILNITKLSILITYSPLVS